MKRLLTLRWLPILLFLVALVSISVLVAKGWNEILYFRWRLHVGYLALTLGFHSLSLGVAFVVWHHIVARLGGANDLWMNFRVYYLSTLAKRVPTGLFYVGGRLIMYKQVGVAAAAIINCTLLENILAGLSGIFTLTIFLPFYYTSGTLLQTALLAIPGVAVTILLLMRPQVFLEVTNRILKYFGKQILYQMPARQDILIWIALYVPAWVLAGLSLYFVPRAVAETVGPGMIDAIRISTLAILVAFVSSILPAGLGLKELTAGVLLSSWMPLSTALVVSLSYRVLQTANEIVWALLALSFARAPKR